jgi:hypothetical protein
VIARILAFLEKAAAVDCEADFGMTAAGSLPTYGQLQELPPHREGCLNFQSEETLSLSGSGDKTATPGGVVAT